MVNKRTVEIHRLMPAMLYALMVGEEPTVRVPGWVALAHAGRFGNPSVAEVWAEHRVAVIAEATAHGFEPYELTDRPPQGPGFEAWHEAFLARHVY